MLPPAQKSELLQIVTEDRYLDRPEELTCYSYDSSLDESLPDAVFFPLSTPEVSAILKIAGKHRIPVTARGAGTSVCGAPIPVHHSIVLCFSRMNRIIEINTGIAT